MSGLEKEVALNPDILTKASAVLAVDVVVSTVSKPSGDFLAPPFD